MEKTERQSLIEAMKSPHFYPHRPIEVIHKETHISDVFLADDLVYKIKKPVNTGFLDFTTLERRLKYCRREVELNRRLTSGIYLGVEKITECSEGFQLNGSSAVVEYAVKMRRLPYAKSLKSMLEHNAVEQRFLLKLTDTLVRFYRQSPTGGDINRGGDVEIVLQNCRENFVQISSLAQSVVDGKRMETIRAATETFVDRHMDLFKRRITEERVRDCHGDLKTEHVYDFHGVQILDCIEFNERFRYQDPAADLAFLAMDMDFMGHSSSALALLSQYVHRIGDFDMMRLIDFYKCYRAMVQVKVHCLRLVTTNLDESSRSKCKRDITSYINLAYRYSIAMVRPVLLVICGLTATGKSTIAAKLSELLSMRWVRSDEIRKEMFQNRSVGSGDGFAEGMYSSEATSLVYAKMLLAAQQELRSGRSVILDATWRNSTFRKNIQRLSRDSHAGLIFVECVCNEREIKRRLLERDERPGMSDARLDHWEDIKATSDPFDDIPKEMHIVVQTDQSLSQSMEMITTAMYMLLEQQVHL